MTTSEAPDQGARRDSTSRRRLLTAGISGAALAAVMAGRASAATEDDDTDSSTTTAAPKRPSKADEELLVFAQAAELAAFELYESALSGGGRSFDDTARSAMAAIRQHHDAYAEAFGGLLGRASTSQAADSVVEQFTADFTSGDAVTVALAAHELEKTLVATHTSLLGELDGTDGSGLVAAVLVVEARHVPVLAHIAGLDPDSDLDLFIGQNDAQPLSPETSA
jgi:hypothetical protein